MNSPVEWGYQKVKHFKYRFSRLNTTRACDGQTDGRTGGQAQHDSKDRAMQSAAMLKTNRAIKLIRKLRSKNYENVTIFCCFGIRLEKIPFGALSVLNITQFFCKQDPW